MIVEEKVLIEGRDFMKRYSDAGFMMRKVNTSEVYAEAIDLLPCNYEYEETNEKIEMLSEDKQ